jgi:hypothetical protein
MALSQGMLIGSCEIISPLGAGGMGEVWRGRDTKLGRDVAVKALPDEFAYDADRLARFEREAQALAALNHPNLGVIHELKEVGGAKYLILELIEGETLAERINRGPVPVSEALDIALQIARAVGAAHEKGIVHRDLKPANVKITPEGRVKVLDFGLAKIYEATDDPQNVSLSPTFSAQTGVGVILGTAAYMSPEQARGKEVDRRADVWAFGCVVYEMLTGRQTFPDGETMTDTLANVLVHEPDLNALPASTPPKVRALVERCLRKDERRRIRDMGDVRIAIEEALSDSAASAAARAIPVASRRREVVFGALAVVFLAATTGLAARWFLRAEPAARPVRLELPVSVGMTNSFYLSPDGRKVAFVTSSLAPARIWVRALDGAAAQPIPSTEGITAPGPSYQAGNLGHNNALFWSADSQYIGFVAEGKLKKVSAAGGPAQVLATLPASGNYFGTWSSEGVILLASDAVAGGPLLRVSAAGGQPAPATELDASRKEQSHRFPHFLPDGRHYLYLSTTSDARDNRVVYVGSLDSSEPHPLEGIAAEVKYSSGHLVFIRDGALMAQPFDIERRVLSGDAFPVADRFAPPGAVTWSFSVSTTGMLAYRAVVDGATVTNTMELSWYDRKGSRLGPAGAEAEYIDPELSPDGKFVAFARGSPADIWTLDIEKGVTSKWTTDAAADLNPRWSPDGKTLAFDSTRDGAANLYMRAVGVTGADRLVLKTDAAKTLSDWSRDGKYLAYVSNNDVWALPLSPDPKTGVSAEAFAKADTSTVASAKVELTPIQVTKTSFIEKLPRISPDSRWIAYVSNKSGQTEVYVQSFPEPGIEQQVSTGVIEGGAIGGGQLRWTRDGTELYYYTTQPQRFMRVAIKPAGTSLNAAAPALLFPHPAPRVPFSSVFSVTTDGRFLIPASPMATGVGNVAAPAATAHPAAQAPVTLIVNWAARK